MSPAEPSIHWRRRRWYAAWVLLLLLALGALVLWETPTRVEQGTLVLDLTVRGAPAGTQVEVWNGPAGRWGKAGGAWMARQEVPATGRLAIPPMKVTIARRRWIRDYLPRGTWDLLVVRAQAPGQAPRYLTLPLSPDIRVGALRQGRRMTFVMNASLNAFSVDPPGPDRVP